MIGRLSKDALSCVSIGEGQNFPGGFRPTKRTRVRSPRRKTKVFLHVHRFAPSSAVHRFWISWIPLTRMLAVLLYFFHMATTQASRASHQATTDSKEIIEPMKFSLIRCMNDLFALFNETKIHTKRIFLSFKVEIIIDFTPAFINLKFIEWLFSAWFSWYFFVWSLPLFFVGTLGWM